MTRTVTLTAHVQKTGRDEYRASIGRAFAYGETPAAAAQALGRDIAAYVGASDPVIVALGRRAAIVLSTVGGYYYRLLPSPEDLAAHYDVCLGATSNILIASYAEATQAAAAHVARLVWREVPREEWEWFIDTYCPAEAVRLRQIRAEYEAAEPQPASAAR